ncbi:MAG TPA: DUF3330 domain-containing protein [Thiobacillaceae bacterium]|nr:DUF3330 domain-containing protein [Thiobacillaceae bacterium]
MKDSVTPAGSPILSCEQDDQCEIVTCKQCLDEIPPSLRDNPEAPEYVAHFCGLECYAEWIAQQAEKEPPV